MPRVEHAPGPGPRGLLPVDRPNGAGRRPTGNRRPLTLPGTALRGVDSLAAEDKRVHRGDSDTSDDDGPDHNPPSRTCAGRTARLRRFRWRSPHRSNGVLVVRFAPALQRYLGASLELLVTSVGQLLSKLLARFRFFEPSAVRHGKSLGVRALRLQNGLKLRVRVLPLHSSKQVLDVRHAVGQKLLK